jgi:hypothetical protein
MKPILVSHFAAAFIVTILCGLIYVSVQQSHRTTANDPQLQVARDMRTALEKGYTARTVTSGDTIDLAGSLATFRAVYDPQCNPIASNGFLSGAIPRIPRGVFDVARSRGEDVVTWQPRRNVRMALVVDAVHSPEYGFAVAGRRLDEVEKRTGNLTIMILIGWAACMGIIILHFLWMYFSEMRRMKD